ncbi:MAG TPA: DegT/DnrJ/EryC1/StrS family aminotransferase [Bryobacteraceae bacterium]|nr:DegT/DnrJ/EryC1/StrS family aminotransferase [Bryobacteraceae bacterium]HUI55911.1 DegT/DnrJ/EryC1/StrS family aminotransferase [Bryobacteraceae bacterium]
MPSVADLLPYLQTIDERCWYSNFGPLATMLEEQMSAHLGMPEPCVVTTANATAGITAALLARNAPPRSLCIMPSWTFAATPHAAHAAGLTPWFHDVDSQTWAFDPEAVRETIERIARPVGAVLVVSPFGAPIDVHAWQAFEDRTGIPVVVDAAAGFDTVRASRIPAVVSLHATKILGAGEGGFIVTTDSELRERIRSCCNFGFLDSRSARTAAINGKMSEYHAAVALAGLARWPEIREQHVHIATWYRRGVAAVKGAALQPGYGNGWVSATTSMVLPSQSALFAACHLLSRGIDTRAWWGHGCHVQPAFADYPRGPLPVTEDLGARVLGLPHFPGIQEQQVEIVMSALSELLR